MIVRPVHRRARGQEHRHAARPHAGRRRTPRRPTPLPDAGPRWCCDRDGRCHRGAHRGRPGRGSHHDVRSHAARRGRVRRRRGHRTEPRHLAVRHRRRRLGQRRAADLHRLAAQQCAGRGGQPRHHGATRGRRHVHLRPAEDRGHLHRAVRPDRGTHPDPARTGDLARVLDARSGHRTGRVADLRRDRRDGERRVRARHRPRHRARTRLLRSEGLSAAATLPNGAAWADAYHVFGVDWRPGSVTWLVDGVAQRTVTRADVGSSPWVFDKPFFVLLNVAVGGTWPGSPDATTRFPQQMLVDWVRVWQQS